MTSSGTHLALEELSTRILPSGTPVAPLPTGPVHTAPPVITPVPTTPPAHSPHPLHGSGAGSYTQPVTVDTGVGYTLTGGSVTLKGLGTFTVTGWLKGVGMIQTGRPVGQLVLTNAHGSLTVNLHGREMPAFSPVPSELVYAIRSGTGEYAALRGYGVAAFAFTPAPTAHGLPTAGAFTVSLF